ncbi:UV DNA damage repair endonuclease UvsE [Halalkalibacter lacteus]|uniref:UV DNA damage repair endonuclease UvsE n=1 Tax=Halalkalibacter lacteus TaxID=3090663 RepID=UPI002FCA721A
MKIGYACINLSLPSRFRTCRLKTVEIEGLQKIKELTLHNFNEVRKVLEWNREHNIFFYRMSSDLVPFATHDIMTWKWDKDPDVLIITDRIRNICMKHEMRLSMHPGQFSILNSTNPEIVRKAILDLEYHNKILRLVNGTDMILHVGGAYGNKEEAKKRFIATYNHLSSEIKATLRLENDDKIFTISDVIDIYNMTQVPICFDFHHNKCNPSTDLELETTLDIIFQSWQNIGRPKMHISSGRNSITDPAHHDYILEDDLVQFSNLIGSRHVDLMFESKRKDESVLRIYEKITSGEINI